MGLALVATELGCEEPRVVTPPAEIDAETLALCRQGDRHALKRFVLKYQHGVLAFLSRMTGRGPHVEDLGQEVFLRAYRALPRLELRAGVRLSTWLLKIAVRLVLDERKKPRLAVVSLVESAAAEQAAPEQRSPESERRQRELLEAFERAAAQLPEQQRAIFVLAQFHDLSMAEIAELCGAPENTVKTRLHRAREKLCSLLRSEWESP